MSKFQFKNRSFFIFIDGMAAISWKMCSEFHGVKQHNEHIFGIIMAEYIISLTFLGKPQLNGWCFGK